MSLWDGYYKIVWLPCFLESLWLSIKSGLDLAFASVDMRLFQDRVAFCEVMGSSQYVESQQPYQSLRLRLLRAERRQNLVVSIEWRLEMSTTEDIYYPFVPLACVLVK